MAVIDVGLEIARGQVGTPASFPAVFGKAVCAHEHSAQTTLLNTLNRVAASENQPISL